MAVPQDHVFLASDDPIAAGLKRATNGQGVDIVLNSVPEELFHAAWDCVAEFGKIVELASRNAAEGVRLALSNFERNRSYSGVDLGYLVEKRPQRAGA